MAVKNKKPKKRPARAGAVSGSSSAPADTDAEETESEEAEEEAEATELDIVTKRLIAPRAQGIVKTILAGIDEMTIVQFYAKSANGEMLVCTVDTTDTSDEIVVVKVEPHDWAEELSQGIWDAVDVEGQDPNIANVTEDGWSCTYPMVF